MQGGSGKRPFIATLLLCFIVVLLSVVTLSVWPQVGDPSKTADHAAVVIEKGNGQGVTGGSGENLSAERGSRAPALLGDGVFTQSPPFTLPASLRPEGYERGRNSETWRAISEESCKDVARDLLLQLQGSGMKLVEAGYLDLFSEAWGCALEDEGDASLTIILVPKKLLRERDVSNPLRMTLIRTAVPHQNILLGETGGEE